MSKETIIDKEELNRCRNDKYYFFKKYVLINGKEPLMTKEQFYELIPSWELNQNKDERSLKQISSYSRR
jgi:hypothetical protein